MPRDFLADDHVLDAVRRDRRAAVQEALAQASTAMLEGTITAEAAIALVATSMVEPDDRPDKTLHELVAISREKRRAELIAEVEELRERHGCHAIASVARRHHPDDPMAAEALARKLRRWSAR